MEGSEDAKNIPQAATQSKASCVDCCEKIPFSVHDLTQEASRHTQEQWEAVLLLESHGIILPAGCFLVWVPAPSGVATKQLYTGNLELKVFELVLTCIVSAIFGFFPCGYYCLNDLD